jgi:hypothetical protein
MTILNRKQILAADDLAKEIVAVPEWGGDVYVRGMSGTERDEFEASVVQMKTGQQVQPLNMKNIRAKLASLTICDEAGKRLFSENDIGELGKKSAAALQRIFEVAQRLSGIGEEDVKELAGEMTANPTEDSPTV